jgi:hypothetical protein
MVQVYYKPSEVVGLAEGAFFKAPVETWRSYRSLFEENATSVCTAPFLAALAQAESSGNPIARTYWIWRLSWNPFRIYAPASSSVGLYQITDGTFETTKEYCIHDGQVKRDGPWHDWNSCWFNFLYNRLLPADAIEMTSAYLHSETSGILSRVRSPLSLKQQQQVAAVIHLCGARRAASFVAGKFRFRSGTTCSGQSVRPYLQKVGRLTEFFERLSVDLQL